VKGRIKAMGGSNMRELIKKAGYQLPEE